MAVAVAVHGPMRGYNNTVGMLDAQVTMGIIQPQTANRQYGPTWPLAALPGLVDDSPTFEDPGPGTTVRCFCGVDWCLLQYAYATCWVAGLSVR